MITHQCNTCNLQGTYNRVWSHQNLAHHSGITSLAEPIDPAPKPIQVVCDECGRVSTPAGIGSHQKASGHVGRTSL